VQIYSKNNATSKSSCLIAKLFNSKKAWEMNGSWIANSILICCKISWMSMINRDIIALRKDTTQD